MSHCLNAVLFFIQATHYSYICKFAIVAAREQIELLTASSLIALNTVFYSCLSQLFWHDYVTGILLTRTFFFVHSESRLF